MGKLFIICIFLLGMVNGLAALSCAVCGEYECPTPPPCPANLVKDVCGCCDVCAKVKGESCGGLWNLEGRCADGLTCVLPKPKEPEPGYPIIISHPDQAGVCLPKLGDCLSAYRCGSCYRICATGDSYEEASETCELQGGRLAAIKDSRAFNFLMGKLNDMTGTTYAWIGLDDLGTEGELEWSDGISCRKRGINFCSGIHPQNTDDNDCVYLSTSYNFGIGNCKMQMPFICEFEKEEY
ncbi:insulin-like growth factor-binding protein 7 [Branchiostoma lanceolatum]|uniref:insulin-like growth factor-binding protein 7 n=1 Tax=Branchiostoma lanceolatum TaxID=7740 RepID=UPI0034548AEA